MHGNARLTHKGRLELVQRCEAGTPPATVARQMNVSRATVYKWWRRTRPSGTVRVARPPPSRCSTASPKR